MELPCATETVDSGSIPGWSNQKTSLLTFCILKDSVEFPSSCVIDKGGGLTQRCHLSFLTKAKK